MPLLRALRRTRAEPPPASAADPDEAEEFLRGYYAEHPGEGSAAARIRTVRGEIYATGTYSQTPDELAWAARLAWRHSARCSGRGPDKWKRLRLRDRRWACSTAEVAGETIGHLREATNRGNIRSVITVFAPDTPRRAGPRIVNPQVLRYAGYRQSDGSFLGDPANEKLTRLAQELGWQGGGGAFDLLPLIVTDAEGRQRAFDIPPAEVLEVPIFHPDYDWFAGLGLKWYAVPVICDMYLDAGGVRYPCAPFSGWYQAGSEVGVRNFGDPGRYDMLPTVAARMGLDTSRLSTLWRDRAAVELAVAVQRSFAEAGVMATDHQSELARLMQFVAAEEDAQRPLCVDWSWVNPPAAAPTPAFFRTYPNPVLKPGFFRDEQTPAG
jgi:nitric-oxide synthase, bacterial